MRSQSKLSQPVPFIARLLQRRVWKLVGLVIFFAAPIAFAVWLVRLSGGPRATDITVATALDGSFRPIEPAAVFAPDATFFVSIKLEAYLPDNPIVARWKNEGQIINETTLSTEHFGDGYAGFSLSHTGSKWPVGSYSFEILSNNQLLGSASLEVKETP